MTPKSPPNITVFDIADWFLTKAKSEDKSLRHMKLQKLVYFAYGWYCAYFDEYLFPEKIFAWPHGPVIEELYHRYKYSGSNQINVNNAVHQTFDDHVAWVMRQVWKNFSHYSDMELSHVTHRPGSPWDSVYDSSARDAEIPPETIREYFKGLREKYENAQPK